MLGGIHSCCGLLVQYNMYAIRSTVMYADPFTIAIKDKAGTIISKPRVLLLLSLYSISVTGKEIFSNTCSHVKDLHSP